MAKQVRSWSKPEGIEDLIGIKKVDYSIFVYGIHIPVSFRPDFLEANQGIEVELGSAKEVTLVIENREFKVDLRNINQSNFDKGALQIRYDNNSDIKEFLIKRFHYSYAFIKAEQERTGKSSITVPDESAEYIEFYKTDTPFKYLLKLKLNKSSLLGYPFRTIFNNSEDVRWSFDFMRKILNKLGISDSKSDSYSITLPKDENAIHVNYYSWRVFGVKSRASTGIIIELALLDKYMLEEKSKIISNFKQNLGEDSISLYKFDYSDIRKRQEEIWKVLDITLRKIKDRFINYSKTPYITSKNYQLAQAVFNKDILERIIKEGIAPEKETSSWIFQVNPQEYNLAEAIKNLDEIMCSVSTYKDQIKPGDKAYLWESGKDAGILAVGEITTFPQDISETPAEAQYRIGENASANSKFTGVRIQIKKVLSTRLNKASLLKNTLLQDLSILKDPSGTNFAVTELQAKELSKIIDNIDIVTPIISEENINATYTALDCATDLGMEASVVERWIRTIERKGQAIIYGPPGTGKTFAATHLAKVLIAKGDGFSEIIQFHPAYAYEDFMQGIRPVIDNGVLSYKLVEGRFMEFCERSRNKSGKCVLIIDEINRANLSRVFGELMYLLEYRNQFIPLAGGKKFSIPENVYIIGTMNTADRSIAIVDHALRRRFAFIELLANYNILENFHKDSQFKIKKLINLLKQINRDIADPRYEIGISHFMRANLREELQDIWEMEIIPYLEEYFFDQPNKVNNYRWDKIERIISDEK